MRRTPVVLGVLSMVFGGLVAAYSLFGLLTQSFAKDWTKTLSSALSMAPRRAGQPDPALMMQGMQGAMDTLRPYTMVLSGGMLIMSLALVVVGVGLYRRQAWSRPAAMLWAAAALAWVPFQIYVQAYLLMPKMEEVMTQSFTQAGLPMGMFQAMLSMQKGIAVVTHLVFYAPFPVILLALIGRSSAKNDLMG